jgi:hypothetical protein
MADAPNSLARGAIRGRKAVHPEIYGDGRLPESRNFEIIQASCLDFFVLRHEVPGTFQENREND